MAFAKGKSYPILIAMAKKDNQAKKLLDNLASLTQEEFEKEFGELLGKHPELDNKTEDYKTKKDSEPFNSEVKQTEDVEEFEEVHKFEVPLWKKVGAKSEDDILFSLKKIEKIGDFEPETFDRPITKSRMLEDIDKIADQNKNGVQMTKDQYAKVRNNMAKWHPENEKILPSPEEFNVILDKMVNEYDEKKYKSILRKSKKYPSIVKATEDTIKAVGHIVKKNYELALKFEKTATKEVSSSIETLGGIMFGLDFRLKTEQSTLDKVERDLIEYEYKRKSNPSLPEKTREQIANEITDLVRYTGVFKDDVFTENVEKSFMDIINKGYEFEKSKQRFYDGSISKDIILKFKKDGQYIELQYHTPVSIDVKMGKLHKLYEVARVVPPNDPFRNEIDNASKRISTRVANPPGVEKLTDEYFRKLAGKGVVKGDK